MKTPLQRLLNWLLFLNFSLLVFGQSVSPDIYIGDCNNYVIRKVNGSTGIITTVAGNGTQGYSGDGGPATSAALSCPGGIALDNFGNLYIADLGNNRVRKVTASTGIITTVAGNGTAGYSGDGGPVTSAELDAPSDVKLDSSGNVYIVDRDNIRIRKVTAATGIITTVAGSGNAGYSGDGGPATSAALGFIGSITVDSSGNIYMPDFSWNVIRKVTAATGIITTVAGNSNAGYSGDGGQATSAELNAEGSVALDSSGNIYIGDSDNNVVRMVTAATGIITTVAGNGTQGYSGDGGPATSATLNIPGDIALDNAGNIYIADNGNRVRKVTAATGIITTVAGNGTAGYSGDGGPATSAEFNGLNGIALYYPRVATPTFNPPAGTYTSAQTVTITTTPSTASIRYTTDGSTPTTTTGTLYSTPIPISATTPLKAIAYASGYSNSPVATAVYTIVPPPSITSITPTSGAAGVQVTISGSNFGSPQGTGTVWLGSTLGAVVSWSNTQIVATVAPNATSGTVQVQQYGGWSNTVPFTVTTATISSITPTSGLPGTQVTITGSGFGATQGTGQVWLGTANGVVQSWSNTQVVALVVTGSASGKAQVLQNGVWSNAIPFTVNVPVITSISPTSGSPGTSATITGSSFGSSQGIGTVLLGSIGGQVISWTDTQVMASVALSSLTGIVRIQQNGVNSNALSFTVPASNAVTLVPNVLNMVVGDTHTIQARNSSGQSVTGLTWASSNTSIVSLSTDDPPILTAIAAGHATITAGSASADVTVFSGALPLGTVLWSNPGNGSGVGFIVPAVPSANGVADVFAFQNDGTVQAITSDGTVAWTANASQYSVPDFQGGLIVSQSDGLNDNNNGLNIFKLDGITGQVYPTYHLSPRIDGGGTIAVHPDGTIFAMTSACTVSPVPPDLGECTESVIGIDPIAGTQKFSVPFVIPRATPHEVHGGIIAGDGYYYVAFITGDTGGGAPDFLQTNHLRLLRVNSAGASDVFNPLAYTNSAFAEESSLGFVHMITNADTGIFLTLGTNDGNPPYLVTTTGASYSAVRRLAVPNGTDTVGAVLQAQDGSFVGSYSDPTIPQIYMIAFDATGNIRWIVPNETPKIATADGGVIGQSGITYDQNGNATGQVNLAIQSWTGSDYKSDGSSVSSMSLPPAALAPDGASFWPQAGANPSGNGTAFVQCPCLLQSAGVAPIFPMNQAFSSTASSRGIHPADSAPPLPTWVILEGEPGLDSHNSGALFDLAARTEQDLLNGLGNLVFGPQLISSVQGFATQLTSNGLITGGVVYFGHGRRERLFDGTYAGSQLSPGQNTGANTNIGSYNVSLLLNSMLGRDAIISLHACYAGSGNAGYPSIAQLIANQLKRTVYASLAGTFFSVTPNSTKILPLPNNVGKPLYLTPDPGNNCWTFNPFNLPGKSCSGLP